MGAINLLITPPNPGIVEVAVQEMDGTELYSHDATTQSPAGAELDVPTGKYRIMLSNHEGYQNISSTGRDDNHLTVDGESVEFQFVSYAESNDHFDRMSFTVLSA